MSIPLNLGSGAPPTAGGTRTQLRDRVIFGPNNRYAKMVMINGSLLDVAANTLNTATVEIPESQGAKGVLIVHAVGQGRALTVANTITQWNAVIAAGRVALTTATLDEEGVLFSFVQRLWAQPASAHVRECHMYGGLHSSKEFVVPADPANGKFYLTIGVKHTNAAAFGAWFRYHLRFLVFRDKGDSALVGTGKVHAVAPPNTKDITVAALKEAVALDPALKPVVDEKLRLLKETGRVVV